MDEFKPTAILRFELEGVNATTTDRWRRGIDTMLMQGVLNVKNGKVILNFDHEGELQEIEFNFKQWRKKKA